MSAVMEPKKRHPVVAQPAMNHMQMLSHAIQAGVPIETLRELVQMKREHEAIEAQKAFNVALTAAQLEMTPISNDMTNVSTRSRYASYAALDRALRPIYTRHGFAISFDEGDSPKPEHVRVLGHVSHIGGFTRTYHRDMPADGKGAKGGDVMTKTHATGAAGQYGMRYILKGVFNVATGEGDTDGNGSGPGLTLTTDQCTVINDLINESKANRAGFLEWIGAETVARISQRDYIKAKRALEDKRDAR